MSMVLTARDLWPHQRGLGADLRVITLRCRYIKFICTSSALLQKSQGQCLYKTPPCSCLRSLQSSKRLQKLLMSEALRRLVATLRICRKNQHLEYSPL